ncbi:MAG: acetyl-CoA acetyltransferase [Hyphomonadaceae bacterium]
MIDPNTPVLIGGGQFTYRGAPESCPPPIGLCARAAEAALADSGLNQQILTQIDGLAVVGFTIDAGGNLSRMPIPKAKNPPKALAKALGASPVWQTYTHVGGNTPQALVNEAAERIAKGDNKLVLLAGAEFLGSMMKLVQASNFGPLAAYQVDDEEAPAMFGDGRDGCSPYEARHGLEFPTNVYPMFENAYRANLGRSLEAHSTAMGALFAPFTEVAAQNPYAWFPQAQTAETLVTPSASNRMVGFPYPKRLNAIIQVDQSAAVLMASYAHAKSLGVSESQMVFLHGCADTIEKWNVLDRVDYHSSPAMRVGVREAFAMAGKSLADMSFFDLYSCFPVAVEIAAKEMGLATDDPRGLTLTGGLPYFGGPGNNYSMHGIVEMIHRCRKKPEAFGFLNANGWFLTKHAFGIYSNRPTEGAWARKPKKSYQGEIDAMASPEVTETPTGAATIETYTVIHAREGMRMGIVIGRDEAGRRFVANTPKGDIDIMADLEGRESVGREGQVVHDGERNIFTPQEFLGSVV